MKKIVFLVPILILIAGYLLMKLLGSFQKEPPRGAPGASARAVDIAVVEPQNLSTQIHAYGRLKSAQPVILNSEVSGKILPGEIAFQPAQSFKKGDLLLRIDDRQAKLDLNSAKSDFLTALASVLPEVRVDFPDQFDIWQSYFNGVAFEVPLVPLPEIKDQKIKLYLSRFNVYKLYFLIRNLEILLAKHYFYAPFDGEIISANLRSGSTVMNGTRLGEIINLEKMEVEFPVAAQDIEWLDKSKPVSLTASEIAGHWQGRIARIGKSIDTRTQSVPVFVSVEIAEAPGLYDGLFLEAALPGKVVGQAVAVPLRALYENKFIYVLSQGKLDYREVRVRRKELNRALVTGSLQKGDSLVVEVLQGVAPGMPARGKPATNGFTGK